MLKGSQAFQRIQMNIGAGPGGQAAYLLRRLTVGEPFIVFYRREGGSISGSDVNGDERLDATLCCGTANLVLLNQGGVFRELATPLRLHGGSRGAAWADYNCDGRPDLLTSQPQLFSSLGGRFPDDSALVQAHGGRRAEAAGWIDYNGEGLPDILTVGEHGIRLFQNAGTGPPQFRDVTERAGLGPTRVGRGGADLVAVADYDGDGYTDFLCNWGDADGDGSLDLFVCCAKGRSRLYLGNGWGQFRDATGSAGLDGLSPAFAASFADVDDDGDPDLMVDLGRKAVLAINDLAPVPGRAWLQVRLEVRKGLVGAVVRILDDGGRPLGLRELNGGGAGELNADEGVWDQTKKALANGRPETVGDLRSFVLEESGALRGSQSHLRVCIHNSDLPPFL